MNFLASSTKASMSRRRGGPQLVDCSSPLWEREKKFHGGEISSLPSMPLLRTTTRSRRYLRTRQELFNMGKGWLPMVGQLK